MPPLPPSAPSLPRCPVPLSLLPDPSPSAPLTPLVPAPSALRRPPRASNYPPQPLTSTHPQCECVSQSPLWVSDLPIPETPRPLPGQAHILCPPPSLTVSPHCHPLVILTLSTPLVPSTLCPLQLLPLSGCPNLVLPDPTTLVRHHPPGCIPTPYLASAPQPLLSTSFLSPPDTLLIQTCLSFRGNPEIRLPRHPPPDQGAPDPASLNTSWAHPDLPSPEIPASCPSFAPKIPVGPVQAVQPAFPWRPPPLPPNP